MTLSTWPTVVAAVTAGWLLLPAAAVAVKPDRSALDCARKAAAATAQAAADRTALPDRRAAAASRPKPAPSPAPASDGNRFDYDSCGCVGG